MLIHKIYPIFIASILMVSGTSPYPKADAASYSYDALARVIRADYNSGFTEEYTYDASGNRTTLNVTSKWISGYGHTSPDTGTTAEMDVEIRASSPETGHFTYNNPGAGIEMSGISVTGLAIENNRAVITGKCTLNGLSGYYYIAALTDGPETLKLEIYTPDDILYFSTGTEDLTDGDMMIGTEPFDRYRLTTSVSPSTGGRLTPDCSGGCMHDKGTIVTITAERNSGYALNEWSGCDSSSNNICIITMGADRDANALFTPCSDPVRLEGRGFFPFLQDAYDAAGDGNIIELQETLFTDEMLYFDRDISVTLKGGFDCTYSNNNGYTILEGTVTISSGTVTVRNIILE